MPRPHPGRGRPEDEQAPGQHPAADPADGPARRRRAALVHGRERVALAAPPGRARRPAGDRPQDAADLLEHRVVPDPLRQRQRLVAAGERGSRRCADRPLLDRWLLSETHRLVREVDRGAGGLRHPAGRAAAGRPSSTTCPTGTSAGRGGGSGRATRRRWPPCTSASTSLTLLLAPMVPFVTERVWQDVVRPVWPDAARLGAPGRLADGRRGHGRRRPGRPGRAGAPAGRARPRRPRRRPRCATGSPWAGPWSAPRGGTRCPTELRRQVADELNVAGLRRAGRASWSTAARRPTSARSARGSASRRRSWRPRSRRPTPTRWRRRCGPAARRRSGSTVPTSRCRPTRCCSPRPRGRAGRWPPRAARRWRWTSP